MRKVSGPNSHRGQPAGCLGREETGQTPAVLAVSGQCQGGGESVVVVLVVVVVVVMVVVV